jgi:Na+-driven multidrug efflux pump
MIGIGSAYYFAFHLHLKASGIWYGLTFGLCSTGIILSLRLVKKLGMEKKKTIIRNL